MNRKYLHLYDLLLKEFRVPEDKAKEMIIGVYESSGMGLMDVKQMMLKASPEDIIQETNRRGKLADQRHQRKMRLFGICHALIYLIMLALYFFFLFQLVIKE